VVIPGFQRNYVWDLRRASKLIESLIIGLPVPQTFLYEEARNRFLVIDGQQRMMSIYYFVKGRFPRKDRRAEIRREVDRTGALPEEFLADDEYFEKFNLSLPEARPGYANKFNKLNYGTLGEYKTTLDLRTVRNVIVKQVEPQGDDSSIYELFNRLNTGGVLLTPQEIRSSMYHSLFMTNLFNKNLDQRWRVLLGRPEPELHMRDIEIMLRALALARSGTNYAPSMVRFLNRFADDARGFSEETTAEIMDSFEWFLDAFRDVPRALLLSRQGKFSQMLFESVYVAALEQRSKAPGGRVDPASVEALTTDANYLGASEQRTTDTVNVQARLTAARALIRVVEDPE